MVFEEIIALLEDSGFSLLASILTVIFSLVLVIVQVKKFRLYKNETKENSVNYRRENYMFEGGTVRHQRQSFDRVVPVYELDSKTNELVVVGKRDLQELVQSSRDCGIDVILEKYGVLPTPDLSKTTFTDEVFDASDVREDLEILSDFENELDEMRIRYGMPMATLSELQSHVATLKSKHDDKLKDLLGRTKEAFTDKGKSDYDEI